MKNYPVGNGLTLYLPESSADNFCKQFGPRSGLTKCRALFDTLMIFLKEIFEKVDLEKISRRQKKSVKITQKAKG